MAQARAGGERHAVLGESHRDLLHRSDERSRCLQARWAVRGWAEYLRSEKGSRRRALGVVCNL
eukprot:6212483-Pleurochrysis_carterae.AAC.2